MHTPLELAEAFLSAGELDDALAALDAAPDDQEARRLRVHVLMHLPGRARDALAALDALTPDDPLLRARILDLLGEDEAAFAAVESMWAAQRDPRSAEQLLRYLQRRGDAERALSLLADLPKTWEWLGWSGDFHALKGDDTIAAEHYCSALDQLDHAEKNALVETQRAHLLLKRADAYRRLSQFAEAEADYQAAEAIIPNDPMIPFNRGLLIFEQGNLRRALPLCRDALDHAPHALRDHMRDVLFGEPRYHMLAQALMA